MTDNWLQAATKRAEAATEGPWIQGFSIGVPAVRHRGQPIMHGPNKVDIAFTAHARTDLPLALRLLERAQLALRAVWQERYALSPYKAGLVKEALDCIHKGDSE